MPNWYYLHIKGWLEDSAIAPEFNFLRTKVHGSKIVKILATQVQYAIDKNYDTMLIEILPTSYGITIQEPEEAVVND